MCEPKVNCLLDFIPGILHRFWFSVLMLQEFLLVIHELEFQESHGKSFVNVTKVRVAAEVDSVIVGLVVDLCNWESSRPSWLHLRVDVSSVNILWR